MRFFIIYLVFFFSSNLFAQSKVVIAGFVASIIEPKIIGARISVTYDEQVFYTTTDSLGNFSISVPTGEMMILINQLGYKSKTLKIEMKKDEYLSIILEQKDTILQEVLITNDSKKGLDLFTDGNIAFNPQKLASIPSILGTTDIIKSLQLTPGVQNSGDANGYLYVRGGEPSHNLMLYAAAPVYGMSHLLGIFPFYNADHIQEVQFDKSNLNAKYGGRLSSTVFVMPYKNVPKDFSVQGNLGLLASQITFSIPVSKHTGLYVSGRKTYIDEVAGSFMNLKKTENGGEQQLKYRFSDCNVTFISEISNKHLITIDGFLSGDKLQVKDSKSNLNSDLKWGNLVLSTAWKYKPSEKTTLKNTLYFSNYFNKLYLLQGAAQMNISSYITDLGYSNSIRFFIKKTPIESGLEYTLHDLQPQKIAVYNLGIDAIEKQSLAIKSNNLAVFISAKPKVADKLFAELGVRFNYYSSGFKNSTFLHLEPRLQLNYILKKDNSFFVNYTRQNQYLNLITTSSVGIPSDFWVGSSDGIPSQSSNEFSVGYNQKTIKQFDFSVSGYYHTMKHLLEYPYGVTQFNEISSLKNDILVGNGKSYGLEWMVNKESGKFRGWLSYTLSWSNRQFDDLNNGNQYFAKYDRRHNLSLVGMFDLNKKWSFGLTQIFSSGNRFTMPTSWYFINNNPVKEYSEFNNSQLPNYIRTDVSVNYFFIKTFKKESALNFSIFNTFNVENPIFINVNVIVNQDKGTVIIKPDYKTLYRILPSINWRFKF